MVDKKLIMNYRDIMLNLNCKEYKAYDYIRAIQSDARKKGFNNFKVMGKKVTVNQFVDFFQLTPEQINEIKFAEE